MFHQAARRFYGNTWSTRSVQLSGASNKPSVSFHEFFYFHTRVHDEQCFAVAELVLSDVDKSTGVVLARYAGGWTSLQPFASGVPECSAKKGGKAAVFTSAVFCGTPRVLYVSSPDDAPLPTVPATIFKYRLATCADMDGLAHFARPDELVGSFCLLPGLRPTRVGSGAKHRVACLGVAKDSRGKATASKPRPAPLHSVRLSRLLLHLPPGLEGRLLAQLSAEQRSAMGDISEAELQRIQEGARPRIVSYTLHIGVHNGRTLMATAGGSGGSGGGGIVPWTVVPLAAVEDGHRRDGAAAGDSEDEEGGRSGRRKKGRKGKRRGRGGDGDGDDGDATDIGDRVALVCDYPLLLRRYCKHTLMALAFELTATVELPPSGRAQPLRRVRVVLASYALLPFDGQQLRLSCRKLWRGGAGSGGSVAVLSSIGGGNAAALAGHGAAAAAAASRKQRKKGGSGGGRRTSRAVETQMWRGVFHHGGGVGSGERQVYTGAEAAHRGYQGGAAGAMESEEEDDEDSDEDSEVLRQRRRDRAAAAAAAASGSGEKEWVLLAFDLKVALSDSSQAKRWHQEWADRTGEGSSSSSEEESEESEEESESESSSEQSSSSSSSSDSPSEEEKQSSSSSSEEERPPTPKPKSPKKKPKKKARKPAPRVVTPPPTPPSPSSAGDSDDEPPPVPLPAPALPPPMATAPVRDSLLAATLQMPLVRSSLNAGVFPVGASVNASAIMHPSNGSFAAPPTVAVGHYAPHAASVAAGGPAPLSAQLSRAARTRLSQHGYTDVLQDTLATVMASTVPPVTMTAPNDGPARQPLPARELKDMECELSDPRCRHEITLQFAAYRVAQLLTTANASAAAAAGGGAAASVAGGGAMIPGSHEADGIGGGGGGVGANVACPRSVFFTFQFYNCQPTRTERMVLRPDYGAHLLSDSGSDSDSDDSDGNGEPGSGSGDAAFEWKDNGGGGGGGGGGGSRSGRRRRGRRRRGRRQRSHAARVGPDGLTEPYILVRESPLEERLARERQLGWHRDGQAAAGDVPSLAIKFVIDTSLSQPGERRQFAEYLMHKTCYVEVWDGDSLLQIGTVALQLDALLRQGRPAVKLANEYDVISARDAAPTYSSSAGGAGPGSSAKVAAVGVGALPAGVVVGKLQLLLTCLGTEGQGTFGPEPALGDADSGSGELGDSSPYYSGGGSGSGGAAASSSVFQQNWRSVAGMAPGLHMSRQQPGTPPTHSGSGRSRGGMAAALGLGSVDPYSSASSSVHASRATAATSRLRGVPTAGATQRSSRVRVRARPLSAASPELSSLLSKSKARLEASSRRQHMARKGRERAAQRDSLRRAEYVASKRRSRNRRGGSGGDGGAGGSDSGGDESDTGAADWRGSSGPNSVSPQELATLMRRFAVGAVLSSSDGGSDSDSGSGGDNGGSGGAEERKGGEDGPPGDSDGEEDPEAARRRKRRQRREAARRKKAKQKQRRRERRRRQRAAAAEAAAAGNSNRIKYPEFLRYIGIADAVADAAAVTAATATASGVRVTSTAAPITVTAEQLGAVEAKLVKVLHRAESRGMPPRECFRHFDKDGDGDITREEFRQGLSELGMAMTDDEFNGFMYRFDADGGGTVDLAEFEAFAHTRLRKYRSEREAEAAAAAAASSGPALSGVEKRLLDILNKAEKQGMVLADAFKHFDKDGSGEITNEEFKTALTELGIAMSDSEFAHLISICDKDGDGNVSLQEFINFTHNARKRQGGGGGGAADGSTPGVSAAMEEKLRNILRTAEARKMKLSDTFGHFDKDGDGEITAEELRQGLGQLGMTMSDEEYAGLLSVFDKDGDGNVSYAEFEAFARSSGTAEARLKAILRRAEASGMPLRKAFKHFDKDGSGEITHAEFRVALKELGLVLSDAEFLSIMTHFDKDGDGNVTADEFVHFLHPAAEGGDSGASGSGGSAQASGVEQRLLKVLRAAEKRGISRTDSFRHFDKDGDGDITREEFRQGLSELGMAMTDDEFNGFMHRFDADGGGTVDLAEFEAFATGKSRAKPQRPAGGKPPRPSRPTAAAATAAAPKQRQYDTSTLRGKLQAACARATRRGIDVGDAFALNDGDGSGTITRPQFEFAIMQALGLSLIEEAHAHPGNADSELALRQLQRIERLRMRSSGRNARGSAARDKYGLSAERSASDADRASDMDVIRMFREGRKRALVTRLLRDNVTREVTLYPSFGKLCFFEVPLTNPYSHEERFVIEVPDPELRVVTSEQEWRHLRQALPPSGGLPLGPGVEADMFCVSTPASPRDGSGGAPTLRLELAVMPGETVFLPFTFLSFCSGPVPCDPRDAPPDSAALAPFPTAADDGTALYAARAALQRRSIPVAVQSAHHGHTVALLQVHIRPRPFIVDRTFRFHQAENEYLKRCICVAPSLTGATTWQQRGAGAGGVYQPLDRSISRAPTAASAAAASAAAASARFPVMERVGSGGAKFIHSPDSNVIVEWKEQASPSQPQEIYLRYRVGPFPSVGHFSLLLYNDHYHSSLHEIWHVTVHSMLRLDIHGVMGQGTPSDLIVRGDRFSRRVQCFSSHPGETEFFPSGPFQLVSGAFNKMEVVYRPLALGTKYLHLHLVDMDSKELVTAWRVSASAEPPVVTKAFDVKLRVGTGTHKRIAYSNQWDAPRVFVLRSSRPSLVRPKDRKLRINGRSRGFIRLWFAPVAAAGVTEVFLFVNDTSDQNEECLLVKAIYE